MQEIIATDIHDFDEEYVVNFDESEDTNFLVLSEDTVKAESTDETNTLSSADYENGIFVFDNADETLKNLEEGESLFIQPNENDIIAVSVDNVEINENNQLVIEGNDENVDEMFDFIKFESTGDDIQTIVDSSVADEGVYFPDLDEGETWHKLAQGEKLNFGYTNNKNLKFEYNKPKKFSLTVEDVDSKWGDLDDSSGYGDAVTGTITVTPNIYFYKKGDNVQIEFNLELNFTMGVEIGVSYEFDNIRDNDFYNDVGHALALKLCSMKIVTSIPGIVVNIEPKVVLEISAKLEIEFSFGVKLGFTYDSTIESEDERFHNSSETIPLTYTVKAEGSISVKLVLDPAICFLSQKIAYVQLECSADFKYSITSEFGRQNMDLITSTSESGNTFVVNSSDSEIHACEFCVSGQISFVADASIKASFLKHAISMNIFEFEHELGTAHISNVNGFNLGECTNNVYKVRFNVYDGDPLLKPLKGVIVELEDLVQTTDLFGNATFYARNGGGKGGASRYSYTVKIGDKVLESGNIAICNAEQTKYINAKEEADGSYSVVDSETEIGEKVTTAVTTTSPIQKGMTIATAPALNKHKIIESLKLGEHINSILYDNGEYWIYGYGDMNGDSLELAEKISLDYPEKVTKVIFEHEDEKNGLTINSIGNSVFSGCKNLPEITIPQTVTRIGKYAFQNCSSLKGFNIPSSVKVIEDYAFANTGYVDVVIPSTVTTLGDYLFSGSTSLKTAVIEDRASLPNFTFNKCISLEEITLPYAGTTLESVNKDESKEHVVERLFDDFGLGETYLVHDSDGFLIRHVPNSLKKITIKGGTRIPSHAFDGFKSVTEFVLPDTITSIGDYAFQNCSSMLSNPMPNGVKTIGSYAYSGCKSLKAFTVPSSVETIREGAFANCTGFTSITVPETIVSLGDYAFSDCTSLKKAEIKPVGQIGNCVLNRCTSLEELTIPYAGASLESVNKEGSSQNIVERLFDDFGLGETYLVHDSDGFLIRHVPNSLKKITITGGTRIPSYAFYGFKSLTEIIIPDTITSIGESAFNECTGLQRIVFNGDAPSISSNAFTKVNTTGYYHKENKTWTDDIKKNYGGNITWHGIELLEITKQPTNGVAPAGKYANVTVEAKGEGLTYKWHFKNKGASKFQPTSSFENETTYSVPMNDARDGRQIYCVITDKHGNSVQSEIVTLYMGNPVEITEQPEIVVVPSGIEAKATIKAKGDGLTYKWYYKNKSDLKFYYTKTFDNMRTYSVKMSDSRDGRQVYCVVTDKYGKSEQSEVITLYMGNPLTITNQPINTSAEYGNEAKVRVAAKGDGLTYKWYYKNKGDSKFYYTKTFDNKTTYSAEMNEARDGRQVYCEITDKYGVTIQTEIVTIGLPVAITEDLVNTAAELGEKVELSVSATGHGLTYEWHYKNKNMKKFDVTKYFTTNTYTLNEMTEARAGREIYCVITDIFGNSVQTETVTIGLPVEIIEQPVNTSAEYGCEAKVRVVAEGDGLTYKWYYKNMDDSKFHYTKTFDNMKTYSVEMNEARDGRQIYCEITDKYGVTIQTEIVTIGLPVEITEDLVDVTAELGEKVEFSVSATGHGLTYEWHYKNKNMKKFDVTENFKTNKYGFDKMTEARAGREVYCVITDIFGNSVQTETVRIDLPDAAAEDTLAA